MFFTFCFYIIILEQNLKDLRELRELSEDSVEREFYSNELKKQLISRVHQFAQQHLLTIPVATRIVSRPTTPANSPDVATFTTPPSILDILHSTDTFE